MATKDSMKKPKRGRPTKPTGSIHLLAHMANFSERAAYSAISEGKLKKVGRGAIRIKDMFEFVLNREMLGTETSLNALTDEEVQANKAALERARADLAETEVGIEKMYLINNRELSGYMVNEMAIFKRELLSLSRTIPSTCYGMDEEEVIAELQRRLQKMCNERLKSSEIDAFVESQLEVK